MGGIDILCVEDDAGLRESLGQLIELERAIPRLAGNGKEALEHLQASQKKPDLILLDWLMPVMNGADFLQARLKNPVLQAIPVVVMTGDSLQYDSAAGLALMKGKTKALITDAPSPDPDSPPEKSAAPQPTAPPQ